MSIVRSPRNDNFIIVNNEVLNDIRLSFEATGILLFMMAHPECEPITPQKIADFSKETYAEVTYAEAQKSISHLLQCGYLSEKPSGIFVVRGEV